MRKRLVEQEGSSVEKKWGEMMEVLLSAGASVGIENGQHQTVADLYPILKNNRIKHPSLGDSWQRCKQSDRNRKEWKTLSIEGEKEEALRVALLGGNVEMINVGSCQLNLFEFSCSHDADTEEAVYDVRSLSAPPRERVIVWEVFDVGKWNKLPVLQQHQLTNEYRLGFLLLLLLLFSLIFPDVFYKVSP